MRGTLVALFVFSAVLFGATFQIETELEYDFKQVFDSIKFRLIVPLMGTEFIASGGFRKDNIVTPPYGDFLRGHYWYWDEGYFKYRGQNIEVDVGVKKNTVGPGEFYNLFLSEKDFSYPTVRVTWFYLSRKISVETLWAVLRTFSTEDKPAKGLVYRRLLLLPLEGLEIGYQESVLFLNRYFDPYYYFVPIPIPGIQEFWHLSAPWGVRPAQLDDNSMVGAYAVLHGGSWRTYAELLIDDINMNRFLSPESYQNPDKIAFLIGFSGRRDPVRFTIEVAGATAYTFERTRADKPYEYVFFEGTSYPIEKNMIGYKYGENNIACVIDFEYRFANWTFSLGWESVIFGTRTPHLPWHGGSMPSGTRWLIGEISSLNTLRATISYRSQEVYAFNLEDVFFAGTLGVRNSQPFVGFSFSLSINM
ncbi:hypothetical protein AJ81_02620 [Pseudothermotoga hypogea DSM 11164 = NBRC 106472]|uniref:Uncharacterized protein n=1 Tax=Pseudothermotoga hypogea DSM 11164 = NBRC 106472 TaxID=1123384 RepID=A0A0X1KPX9_9THEM|nr:hypothetical protein [Pseudothermotoga hypogea]AJC73279.1 hypothetical protein AJ81_02620 [Pseudothermotoga hypogea DSM 11164 = NBRC 106472]